MSRATSIINRIGRVLNAVKATDRDVYKRLIVRTGGDPLTGRGVVADTQDILLDPVPEVHVLGPEDCFVLTPNGFTADGSLVCTVSSQAVSRAEIQDVDMSVVFKDSDNNEEEFFIADFNFDVFQGELIDFQLLLRSKQR